MYTSDYESINLDPSAEVELICVRPKAGVIQVELLASQPFLCPSCGSRSSRVHNRYLRTIADLPWEGIPVRILLVTWFLAVLSLIPKARPISLFVRPFATS